LRQPIKHAFLWPAVLVVLAVTLFPLVYSLSISFQQMRLVPPSPPRFVGLDNYVTLLSQGRFWQVLGNTAVMAGLSVALQYVIGFAIALALHAKVPGERLFRVTFLLPMLMAPVAVALIWRMLFHSTLGPVNQLMTALGFANLPFLTDPTWATAVIVMVETWQWTPFVVVLMLAGLQSLPEDIYEAARLEDASVWRQFWTITFPLLLPVSVGVVLIRLIEALKIVDSVFVLTGGGPGTATETLTLYAYQEGLRKLNLGYTAALSFTFLVIVVLIGTLYMAALRPVLRQRA
jgi:multiple sugar transport system permease protein